jgi:hypothetical protein
LAVTVMRLAAAVPMSRLSIVADAPPEYAVILAAPLWPVAVNLTVT